MIERSLIVFKPDAVSRWKVGEILSRLEKIGLKIIGCKMLKPDYEFFYHHYETIGKMISRHDQGAFDRNLSVMQKSPVVAMVIEGIGAIQELRKLVWSTEPFSSQPWTVRGSYAHVNYGYANGIWFGIPNLIHTSGDADEAELEISHWFDDSELFDYGRCDELFMR